MSIKSRSNVYRILSESPFTHEEENIKFFFASQNHLDSFTEKKEENRNSINGSLSNRFKMAISLNVLADITLYSKIETRGFYLEIGGVSISWLDKVILDGIREIKKV